MIKENGVLKEVTDSDIELLESNPKKFWEGVTEIGENAFKLCTNLKNIIIPNSVVIINDRAFFDLKNLQSIILSDGISEIGDECFAYCNRIQNITIPKSVNRIGQRAFMNCRSLANVDIKRPLLIGENAFLGCENRILHLLRRKFCVFLRIPQEFHRQMRGFFRLPPQEERASRPYILQRKSLSSCTHPEQEVFL